MNALQEDPSNVPPAAANDAARDAFVMDFLTSLPVFDFSNSPRHSGEMLRKFCLILFHRLEVTIPDQSNLSRSISYLIRTCLGVREKHPHQEFGFWNMVKAEMMNNLEAKFAMDNIEAKAIKNVTFYYTEAFKLGISKSNRIPDSTPGGGSLYFLLAEWVHKSGGPVILLVYRIGIGGRLATRDLPGGGNPRKRARLEGPGEEDEAKKLKAARKEIREFKRREMQLLERLTSSMQEREALSKEFKAYRARACNALRNARDKLAELRGEENEDIDDGFAEEGMEFDGF